VSQKDRLAVIVFALLRTAFCTYRAITQSLTSDEAFSYNNFITGPWGRLYARYDANNHVLYSILAKLSIIVFGTSEFTLRLPSVIAGFFFVLGVYWVLAATTASRAVHWTALLALGLHPLLLDFSAAGRGYGLSLTLLTWAIYFFLRQRDLLSGALLGLGISANLTILFPAVGLVLCPFALRRGDSEKRIQSCLAIAFTATGVFGVICYAVLSKASTSNFYVGIGKLSSAIFNLIVTSVRGSERVGLLRAYNAMRLTELVILPLLTIFSLVASAKIFLRSPDRRPALAPMAILVTAVVELVASHHLAGLPYPVDRLGLYLILLLGLAWAISVSATENLLLRLSNGFLAGLLVIQFATQLQTRYFQVWIYDLPAKDVARRLLDETRDKPPNSVKVSVTWWEQPALEFYRGYYRISSLQPIQRYEVTPLEGFDYYVIHVTDDKSVRREGLQRLRPLLQEPVSGVLLAKEP
jgi:hypothetical protein